MQDIFCLFVLCCGWQLIAQELLSLDFGGHVEDCPWSYRDVKLRNRRYDLSPRTEIYLISYPSPTLVWPPCQSPRAVEWRRRLSLGASFWALPLKNIHIHVLDKSAWSIASPKEPFCTFTRRLWQRADPTKL